MSQFVTTRVSLLLRLRDPQDAVSWADFVELYAPILFRYGRRSGLQDSDAADLTQDVLTSVFEAIGKFDYDQNIGRFRGWLKTIAYHAVCSVKRRQNRLPITGSAIFTPAVKNLGTKTDSQFWDEQYSRRLFHLAAEEVQQKVKTSSWEAFVSTTMRSEDPNVVADRLGMTVGAVYVAKSRVLARVNESLRRLHER